MVSEVHEETTSKVNVINANSNLKENEILAQANLIRTEMLAQGETEAGTIRAQADAYRIQKISEAQNHAAVQIGQAINLEGQAEQEKLRGVAHLRRHEQAMGNLAASSGLGKARGFSLFTKDQDYLMALKAQQEAMKLI